ncbi:hypothetical protein [Methylobacter sp. S3L5C]|uniref:hypothetical protein n=1 Tax=Methylobacter sp. S3L5C TaxID=2839024 RepID=UPI001FAD9A89|nr:hypothetical protein [Methylobacter sp. S3L5C]UOA10226.1 hypothetical protein KKZ03_08330 [Methylobacter sp. S3L5C]
MKKLFLAILFAVGFCSQAMANVTYFSDNFDNLSAWTLKSGGSYASVSNNKLSFTSGNSQGDIFTTATFNKGYFNFDYSGVAGNDAGGYFGISTAFAGDHTWIAGSSSLALTPVNLVNDGLFHTYSIAFDSASLGVTAVHIMLEQFGNNTPGLATFARVSVTESSVAAVPVPGAIWLFVSGLLGLAALRKKA